MLNGPLLVTERLILRPPAAEDFDAFAEMCAEEETMTFIGGSCARSQAWRQWCTLDGWPAPEIAYGVRAKFAGKGYAFEGAVAACDFAVEFLKWPDLMHSIAPDNVRSQALAKRLGATNRGPTHLPAPFEQTRVDAWTQSAEAWRIKRKEFQP